MDQSQQIIIKDRKSLVANAVNDIENFSDELLVINTEYGKMCVEGRGLKILQLSENTNEISVNGEIGGVFFVEEKAKKSIFRRGCK